MRTTLVVYLRDDETGQKSVWKIVEQAAKENQIRPIPSGAIVPVGRDGLLFGGKSSHGLFVEVLAHLRGADRRYMLIEIDASSLQTEGSIPEDLKATLAD